MNGLYFIVPIVITLTILVYRFAPLTGGWRVLYNVYAYFPLSKDEIRMEPVLINNIKYPAFIRLKEIVSV